MSTFEIETKEFSLEDTINNWPSLNEAQRSELFFSLSRDQAEDLFLNLSSNYLAEIFQLIPEKERRSWIRLLAPDDVVDLIQELPNEFYYSSLDLLDQNTRTEVNALLAYEEDEAGGLMSNRFARLRPEMTVDEALKYLRAQSKGQVETIYYGYVLDKDQKLLGVVSLRELFLAQDKKPINEIMSTDIIKVEQDTPQEEIGKLFSIQNLIAIPVVDGNNVMIGIVTVDDIVSVYQEEATEDIQKIGGMEALDEPYLDVGFFQMVKKRAVWLLVLFVGEMFTATAMAVYEAEIQKAVMLALFIPLVISSGGNSGSQATTLIIRALALGELRLKDWWKVFYRELGSGLALGIILGAVGVLRVLLWPNRTSLFGEHYVLVSFTLGLSLVGIVLWGSLTGSMLPFLLRRLKLDPATASAPFVATIVDVTGLVIYFSVARLFLRGILI
jgi:magnesium transporter